MKNKYFLFLVLLSFSCTKDEFKPSEWGPTPRLEISPLAVILTPNNLCDTVCVESNYNYFTVSAPSWVQIEKIETRPAIIVSADSIIKDDYREAYVTITIKRGKQKLSRDFVVMQFKSDVFNP